MSEPSPVFRKVSLDRISSPEQLDQKLTVVSPIGWIAVTSLCILITAVIFWGFLGIVIDKVIGNGMLMYTDGIVRITSNTSGKVTEVNVHAGDLVEKGQIIARVSQDDLVREIENIKKNIKAIENINVETLELDIDTLNTDIYSEFSQIATQIRTARIQYKSQKSEAEKNEKDVVNQKEKQGTQITTLKNQISTLENQISEYEKLLEYQRQIDLENANIQDNQRDSQQNQVGSVLNVLEEDLSRAKEKKDEAAILFKEGVISKSEFDTYTIEVDRIEGEIKTKMYDIRNEEPKSSEQLKNRPIYDTTLASMQSQLQNFYLQLKQAETDESQLINTFTDYVWGSYNQTSEQLSSLIKQFSDRRQVMLQEFIQRLEVLEEEYAEKTIIKAEFSGILSALTVQPYDFIQPGNVIGNIVRGSLTANSSSVLIYVPIDKGKLVEKGMEVNISPTTVNREEYGYILGNVVSVSASSVTQEHMMTILQNNLLVQAFGGQMAVIEVEVELIYDENTISGYKWSTPKGTPFTISPGTICVGEIVVADQRPIELVVPFIKKLFR